MWSKEEIIVSLENHEVVKWKLAQHLNLEKPWNKYKRDEFAMLLSQESLQNESLRDILVNARKQRLAHEELEKLYFIDHNTNPPIKRNIDWVMELQKYKNETKRC
ncbi:hypothetical protein [Bacillus thuringiensis]|uniref:hypothetical protein n=1 Tax=Bacillus thuringiensis TaxID=1428 RepID=UPI0024BCF9D3|nr:hypothetical protein [Bacillus thuringiensis]